MRQVPCFELWAAAPPAWLAPVQQYEVTLDRWELIDSSPLPDGRGVLRLSRLGHDMSIDVDGQQLMGSWAHASEDALGELSCEVVRRQPCARVLIGGLGMGFTLAAALGKLDEDALVVVAELIPAVVRWNQGVLGAAAGRPLDDARVQVYHGDVADRLAGCEQVWNAILLDVDNGPSVCTHVGNAWLYTPRGLSACFDALAPGGVLGVWSAWDDSSFTQLVSDAGFRVLVYRVRAQGSQGGARHAVWMALRPR